MKTFLFGFLAMAALPALAKNIQPPYKIAVEVTEKGFQPNSINVRPGTNLTLEVTRKTDSTCSTEIQIPSKKVKIALPLNQTVTVALGLLDKGEVRFGCGMDMMEGGKIIVR